MRLIICMDDRQQHHNLDDQLLDMWPGARATARRELSARTTWTSTITVPSVRSDTVFATRSASFHIVMPPERMIETVATLAQQVFEGNRRSRANLHRQRNGQADSRCGTLARMSAIARLVQTHPENQFAIYCDGSLVANVKVVTGLTEAIAATEEAGLDLRDGYIAGLHVAGLGTAATSKWFVAWRSSGGKRDLVIHDRRSERRFLVTGAFISAWTDGRWYDLVIDSVVVADHTPE